MFSTVGCSKNRDFIGVFSWLQRFFTNEIVWLQIQCFAANIQLDCTVRIGKIKIFVSRKSVSFQIAIILTALIGRKAGAWVNLDVFVLLAGEFSNISVIFKKSYDFILPLSVIWYSVEMFTF